MSPEGIPATEMPEAAELPVLAEEFPTDDLIGEGVDQAMESPQAPEMTPEEQAQTAQLLGPFIDLGIKLVQTVPGWL
jgi:hypothetical protein